jgi:hypothetical protein
VITLAALAMCDAGTTDSGILSTRWILYT